jgi:hypothetical protein
MSAIQNPYLIAGEEHFLGAIDFGKIKVGAVGNRTMPITRRGKPLMVKMPAMLTWGVDNREFDGKRKLNLSLQFPTNPKYSSEAHEFALENFKAFELEVKKQVFLNAKECLNKTVKSLDVIDALWSQMLCYSKNKETNEPDLTRAPTLKIKIPEWGGKINVDVFDHERKILFPNGAAQIEDVIPKQATVECLLVCGGVWFAGNGSFGVTWKLSQCRVQEARGGVPRGVCVFGDEEGAPSKPAAPKALAAAEPEPVGSSSLEVLSDDELEDVASMHASDPAHGDEAPVKGRKKVVKK